MSLNILQAVNYIKMWLSVQTNTVTICPMIVLLDKVTFTMTGKYNYFCANNLDVDSNNWNDTLISSTNTSMNLTCDHCTHYFVNNLNMKYLFCQKYQYLFLWCTNWLLVKHAILKFWLICQKWKTLNDCIFFN